MFSKAPETFDAVDMIFRPFVDHVFRVIDGMMFPQTLQRIVALESVGIVDRPLSCLLTDDGHEVVGGNPFHDPGVNPPVPLQEAEDDAFAFGSATALPLPPSSEIRLVHLDLPREFRPLKLRNVIKGKAQFLVNPGDRLVVCPEVIRQPVGGLLLVKSGDNSDLRADLFQTFLFATQPALHVASGGPVDLERTAEYALFSPQKVGRATENVLSCVTHKDILMPYGYESH